MVLCSISRTVCLVVVDDALLIGGDEVRMVR